MRNEIMQYADALRRSKGYPFGLVRCISRAAVGRMPLPFDENELLEARFFDENSEIHIFRKNGALCAVLCEQEDTDRYMEESYEIDNAAFGKRITVRYNLASDEDGQTYITGSRLTAWSGGEENV